MAPDNTPKKGVNYLGLVPLSAPTTLGEDGTLEFFTPVPI